MYVAPYLAAHTSERVLSKGDSLESGYSEVMIAQFILNCRLFKESANVCWAPMSCSSRLCRGTKIKREIEAEIEPTFGRDHTLIIEGHEKL